MCLTGLMFVSCYVLINGWKTHFKSLQWFIHHFRIISHILRSRKEGWLEITDLLINSTNGFQILFSLNGFINDGEWGKAKADRNQSRPPFLYAFSSSADGKEPAHTISLIQWYALRFSLKSHWSASVLQTVDGAISKSIKYNCINKPDI